MWLFLILFNVCQYMFCTIQWVLCRLLKRARLRNIKKYSVYTSQVTHSSSDDCSRENWEVSREKKLADCIQMSPEFHQIGLRWTVLKNTSQFASWEGCTIDFLPTSWQWTNNQQWKIIAGVKAFKSMSKSAGVRPASFQYLLSKRDMID